MSDEAKSRPSFSTGRRLNIAFDVVLRTLVVLAVVVMANYLAGKFFFRHGLSAKTGVELFPRTLNLLRSVTNQINVIVYYDKDDPLYPGIESLLREFQAANSKVRVRTVDYLTDPVEARRVKTTYKLAEASDNNLKNLVIFDCDGRQKIIPGSALADRAYAPIKDAKQGEPQYEIKTTALRGEMLFSGAILTVMNPRQLKAYVLQGRGEHLIESSDEVSGYANFKSTLGQNSIQTESLSLFGTNSIPQDCNLLIIAGPSSPYPAAEVEAIQKFLDEGGRLFVLLNSATPRQIGLEKVLMRWGVRLGSGPVRDPVHYLSPNGLDVICAPVTRHPVSAPLIGSQMDMIAPLPVFPIENQEKTADAPTVEKLIGAAETAIVRSDPTISKQIIPLAVAVEKGNLKGVVTERGLTRMVVVGDSYFLCNEWIKMEANAEFVSHAVNWLLDRSQLLEGIGPRPVKEYRLALTPAQTGTIHWILFAALPGGILFLGMLVWLRRRR